MNLIELIDEYQAELKNAPDLASYNCFCKALLGFPSFSYDANRMLESTRHMLAIGL
jgi:hypothetical protein